MSQSKPVRWVSLAAAALAAAALFLHFSTPSAEPFQGNTIEESGLLESGNPDSTQSLHTNSDEISRIPSPSEQSSRPTTLDSQLGLEMELRSSDNVPLEGWSISARLARDGEEEWNAITNAKGICPLALPAGEYKFHILNRGGQPFCAFKKRIREDDPPVRLTLPEFRVLRVSLGDSNGGPVSGADIKASPNSEILPTFIVGEDIVATTRTFTPVEEAMSGRYVFGSLPSDFNLLEISAEGFSPHVQEIFADQENLHVLLDAAIPQAFIVTDAASAMPIEGAQIAFSHEAVNYGIIPDISWKEWERASTDSTGKAAVPSAVKETPYIAVVFADGYQPKQLTGFSSEGAKVIEVALDVSLQITGKIIGSPGTDYSGYRVAITGMEAGIEGKAADTLRVLKNEIADLDDTGSFEFNGLPSGMYVVEAWAFYGQRQRKGNVRAPIGRLVVAAGTYGVELRPGDGLEGMPMVEVELEDQLGNLLFPKDLLLTFGSFPRIESGDSPVVRSSNYVPVRLGDKQICFGLDWQPRSASVLASGYSFEDVSLSSMGEDKFLVRARAHIGKSIQVRMKSSNGDPLAGLHFVLEAKYPGAPRAFTVEAPSPFVTDSSGICHDLPPVNRSTRIGASEPQWRQERCEESATRKSRLSGSLAKPIPG